MLVLIAVLLVLTAFASCDEILDNNFFDRCNNSASSDDEINDSESPDAGNNSVSSDDEIDDSIPSEYKTALKKAKSYDELMHMSKAAIYDQLISEYGDKFTAEEAQYAIDNLD